MRINRPVAIRLGTTLGLLAILLAAAGALGSRDLPVAAANEDYPPDVTSLLKVAPAPTSGYISRATAMEVAARESVWLGEGRVDAYLVFLTDPDTLRSDEPIRDRAVWLVRYSGLTIGVAGPPGPDGAAGPSFILKYAYVYVDATTGDWIGTRAEG